MMALAPDHAALRRYETANFPGSTWTKMAQNGEASWFEDYAEEADDIQVEEYDITAAPNDFNVLTIFNFLEDPGAVRIPGFPSGITSGVSRACIQD